MADVLYTGGGKSTIANLITRFWDVQEGTVRISGVDVRDMDYNQWMRQVSIVFQDTTLFKTSILDKVAFYKPGATREEVLREGCILESGTHEELMKQNGL